MFRFSAPDSIAAKRGTFFRASTATRRTVAGTQEESPAHVPRFPHYELDKSRGVYVPTLLLENERTNISTYDAGFNTWGTDAGTWLGGAADGPFGDPGEAWQLTCTSLDNRWDTYRGINGLAVGQWVTFSIWARLGTATNLCFVQNNSQAWGTGVKKEFTSAEGLSADHWTRLQIPFQFPASGAANLHLGNHQEQATGLANQSAGTVYLAKPQIEYGAALQGQGATSQIPVPDATWVTRGRDSLSFPVDFPPQELTIYARWIDYGNRDYGRPWGIGPNNAGPETVATALIPGVGENMGKVEFQVNNDGIYEGPGAPNMPTQWGDMIEQVAQLRASDAENLISLNRGPVGERAFGPHSGLRPTWGPGARITIAGGPNAGGANMAFLDFLIAKGGHRTHDFFRRIIAA